MSKPTQEQVIAWARDSGFERNTLGWSFTYGKLDYHLGLLAALAYEAGRKDENDACEAAIKAVKDKSGVNESDGQAWLQRASRGDFIDAIRARGNHD